ncbi:ESX secretion-associated protein EspG [Nocardia sp. NPDC052566]|uniref:ESX secretion-associated protein EspG n=1 Tax=Nocardia sp. NPDC052566 TaxID=3364330 RepID=UPI0037CAF945
MSATWSFSDLDFMVLWERNTDLPLPYPFTYTCRYTGHNEYERAKVQVWERLRDSVPTEVVGAIETVCRPDVFVSARGWCADDMDNPGKRIRIVAARSAASGYVLSQLPGETVGHSGGYTIAECDARGLGATVVAALPAVPAGRRSNVPIVAEPEADDDGEYRGPLLLDGDDSREVNSRRFLELPATTTGEIIVRQGRSKFGPRGILEQVLSWRDLPDDGRYVIVHDDDPIAVGTGTQRLIGVLDEAIDLMVDRLETHWETGDSIAGRRYGG